MKKRIKAKRVKAGTSKVEAARKRAAFVEAMCDPAVKGNATQAAIVAGYSAKTAAAAAGRLLRDVRIAVAIERRRAEVLAKAAKNTEVTKEWILSSLKTVAERCLQTAPVLDRKGFRVLTKVADGNLAVAYTFEAAGASRALELLGKERGMFVDRKEVGEPGAFDKLDDDELERAIAETEQVISAARAARGDDQKPRAAQRKVSARRPA